MTDWTAIARARALDIPPDDLAKLIPVMDALEEAFRPLVKELSYTESE